MRMTNWHELITKELKNQGETFDNIISSTLNDDDLHREFDCSWGGAEGVPFTIWTTKRVYFPVCYDGSEWVASVSRNPDGIATDHIGGG